MKKGFTLLELIIVIIIIGVLVSLGLPQFFKTVEKGRHAEGTSLLGVLRSAQLRNYAEKAAFATAVANLDVDYTTPRYFNAPVLLNPAYAEASVIVQMTRNATQRPTGYDYRLDITVGGTVTCINLSGTGCASLGY